jgi:hypothetical protein
VFAPEFQANGSLVSDVGNISVGPPASHLKREFHLLSAVSANAPFTTPVGTTLIAQTGLGPVDAAGGIRLGLFWKFAASAAEGNITVLDTGDHQSGVFSSFRGVYLGGTPAVQGVLTGTGTAVTFPGGETEADNALVLMIVAHSEDINGDRVSGQANASLSGVAEVFSNGSTTGTGGGLSITVGTKATAGVFTTGSATLSTSGNWVAYTVVLNSLALPAGDGIGPIVSGLTPADAGNLPYLDPVEFDYTDADGIGDVTISVWFENESEPVVIYDGTPGAFRGRWAQLSERTGSAVSAHFSLFPVGGWRKSIDRLRVNGFDIYGIQGA